MFILLQPLRLLILKNILLPITAPHRPFLLRITRCLPLIFCPLLYPQPLHQNLAIHLRIREPPPPPHILIFLKIFAHIRPTKNNMLYNHLLTMTMKRQCQSFLNRNQLTKESKLTQIQSIPMRSTIILTNMEQSQTCLPTTTSSRNQRVPYVPTYHVPASTNQKPRTNRWDTTQTC